MPARIHVDTQEIIHRYVDCEESSDEIAESLNVSASTILNRLREAGITPRPVGPTPIYDEAEVCRLYKLGVDVPEIIQKTGVENPGTFYSILRKHNIPVRVKRNRHACPHVRWQIVELHEIHRLTRIAISEKMRINREYVGNVLREEEALYREACAERKARGVREKTTYLRGGKKLVVKYDENGREDGIVEFI